MMKYAYLPASTFQKEIFLSDVTSLNGKFELVWSWRFRRHVPVHIITTCLLQLIEKYEILRTSIIIQGDSIVQKIAQEPSQSQVIFISASSVTRNANFFKSLADTSFGISFIIAHDDMHPVDSIFAVASHTIIDALSINLLSSEICFFLENNQLPQDIYEFQFADLTEQLDAIEQKNISNSQQDDIFSYDSPVLSIGLDSQCEYSSTWFSERLALNTVLSLTSSNDHLTLVGRLFQQLISKLGIFLNQPILHVGLALDSRNFLNLPKFVGPLVLLKKGAFNIRNLNIPSTSPYLSDFIFASSLESDALSLVTPTTNVDVLFNLIVESDASASTSFITVDDYNDERGANVPLTLDCRVNQANDQLKFFLRSNSSSLQAEQLALLGHYLTSQQELKAPPVTSPRIKSDLIGLIKTILITKGPYHCLHWISDEKDVLHTYSDLRCRVETYSQSLLDLKISSCRVLIKCSNPFEYIASMLALVLTNNVIVPLDERRSNDINRVHLMESICHYELSYDLHTGNPVISSFISNIGTIDFENESNDICIMFTSGSTGSPKGVRITSEGIYRLHRLGDERSWNQLNFLMHSDVGFDASLFELWIPLLSGGKITCIDHFVLMQRGIIVDVDCAWLSVSMFTQLLRCTRNILKAKVICTGGEHVPYSLVSTIESCGFFECGNQLFNGYGPTESTTFIFLDKIDPSTYANQEGIMSSLLPGTQVLLQSFLGQETPLGGIGELIVSGDGVANGYFGTRSESGFFSDQFQSLSYRTGDFFQRISNSSYRFIGRADDLLKISGYRVSLEQIRLILSSYLPRTDVFVLKIDADNSSICVAFVQSNRVVNQLYLRNVLDSMRRSVPHYLIPKDIILVEDIPCTPNGKVDKNFLRSIYYNSERVGLPPITADELVSSAPLFHGDFIRDISHLTHDSLALVGLYSRLCDLGFEADIQVLSRCRDTSDLSKLFINIQSEFPELSQLSSHSLLNQCSISSSFQIECNLFDQVALLCYLTTLFEVFNYDMDEPFHLIDRVIPPVNPLDAICSLDHNAAFPIYCTYSGDDVVTINLYSNSSYFSIFAFHEVAQSCSDYLTFKGTPFSRLSKLKSFISSLSNPFLLRHSSISISFLLASIHSALNIFDFSHNEKVLVLLPCPSSTYINASLFEITNGRFLPFNSTPGASDTIFFITTINNTNLSLPSKLSSRVIFGSLSSTQLSWFLDDVSLVYQSPSHEDSHILSFRSPPSSWFSKGVDNDHPLIVIISPIADDLSPVLPLAKAFVRKGYSVQALTYGLLNRPSIDTLEQQAQRILDSIDSTIPCIFIGYSYSGLIANLLGSYYSSSDDQVVIIDTPNPQLLQHELEKLSFNSSIYWLSQVCRRLLKSVDCDEFSINKIISFIESSSLSFPELVISIRYQLIAVGAISYSTAVDDLLCWIDSSIAQFQIFRDCHLRPLDCRTSYVCANTSNYMTSALDSWHTYCNDLRVINVHADHYSILKSVIIDEYINDLLDSFA